jgi:prepilin-type N-terminal cleavage/methylation domain-containing protein
MHHARGFSLLEVLIATTILSVSLAALAELCTMSTRANSSAKTTTYAVILAQQKMEQLRSLTWGFDAIGLPVTDTTTDTTVVPERDAGGKGLTPSPLNALLQNTDGYVDYVDNFGRTLGGGATPSDGTVYIRRWSIEPLPANPDNTVVIQVLVTRRRDRGAADIAAGVARQPDEARVISVKTRKAP